MCATILRSTAFFTLLLCSSVFSQEILQGVVWQNEYGSTLHIESVSPTGQITGYYINKAPGFSCQNTPYAVTGWTYSNTITFSVRWDNTSQNCNSQTAWTGFVSQGKIITLWQLVTTSMTNPNQILKGEDIFTLVSKSVTDMITEKRNYRSKK